jgi:hypothetical protein
MYALAWENGHIIWKEWWYAITSRVLLQVNLHMTREDQVFVVDVVVTDLT